MLGCFYKITLLAIINAWSGVPGNEPYLPKVKIFSGMRWTFLLTLLVEYHGEKEKDDFH